MKINHIVNNTPVVAPTRGAASGSACATGSFPATTMASDTTRHAGDSPSLSVQQVSRQVGSGGLDTTRVGQIRSATQNGTLEVDAGKVVDAAFPDAQSLLSTRSKKV